MLNIKLKDNNKEVVFNGDMTIYEAEPLYQEIREKIVLEANMELNLSQVAEIDTSGVQLLLFLCLRARSMSLSFQNITHSEVTAQAFELLQLDLSNLDAHL